ncbi:MAG TPA: DinB family protein [Balneolales bacterium]|nr:DinB family protein [Balneolales bacterium]
MKIIPLLLKEFDQEAEITRKFLNRVPVEKFEWQPHKKSMKLKNLVVHIAELPGWVAMGLNTNEMDFAASPYEPTPVSSLKELLELHQTSIDNGRTALEQAEEDDLRPTWKLKNGGQVLSVMTKYEVIRHSFSQTTHHRAQLGVYLRLLDIPVPGSYGPSADEPGM